MTDAPKGTRWLYITLGCICVVLAVIGIPLPLLPTTPFLLLAAFCFARGSGRLHAWLLSHHHLGPPILRWQEYGAISREAKWLGTVSLLVVVAVSYFLQVATWILIVQVCVLVGVAALLWSRPEPPGTV